MTAPTKSLPRRDFFLLPLVSLLTALLLTGASELIARQLWPTQEHDECAAMNRHSPNCVTTMKNIEGPWVEYRTNACGYRGDDYCGPKFPGTWRAVVMGTSAAWGLHVPYDEFFSTVAAPQLSHLFQRPVEFENMGDIQPNWIASDASFEEMASLKPDAVFLVITPFDLNRTDDIAGAAPVPFKMAGLQDQGGVDWTAIRLLLRESRALFMAQHYMLDDRNFFIRAFQDFADPFDSSRSPTPAGAEVRFRRMDLRVQHFAAAVRAANAEPFMIALPNRAQCALISNNISVPHADPYTFARRLRASAAQWGVNYIDMIPEIKNTPKAETLFYSVDGHPSGGANQLVARVTVQYFKQHHEFYPKSPAGSE